MKRFRSLIACAGVITSLLAGSAAHAQSFTGTVSLPCTHPSLTYSEMFDAPTGPNGVCGYRFDVAAGTHGRPFKVVANRQVDLSIYFYEEGGSRSWCVGCAFNDCSDIDSGDSAFVPAAANKAVVVMMVAVCGMANNVAFTYQTF